MFRDRIVELVRVGAEDIEPDPRNHRRHGKGQRSALEAVLRDVGLAGAAIGVRRSGRIRLIDGHLRREILVGQQIPVLIVDLNDTEAAELLLTFDAVGDLATTDKEALARLAADVRSTEAVIQKMVTDLTKEPKRADVEPEPEVDDDPPPAALAVSSFQIMIDLEEKETARNLLAELKKRGFEARIV